MTEHEPLTGPPGSRFADVSRRAFLRRSAVVAGGVAAGGLAACSSGGRDSALLSATTTAGLGATTTSPAGTASTTGPTEGSTGSTEPTPAGDALPIGAELAVAFTYTPDGMGGRVENPYVAVWMEDGDGALVKALGVWYRGGRKEKYLSELRRWSSLDGTSTELAAVSSATRTPGDYALIWDGADRDGTRVPVGQYFVCIEAAREHGPHSLIRQAVDVGSDAFTTDLPSDGELSGASADYRLA